MHYYLRHNNWNIIYYKNANDTIITDNTLKYALQSVGCIHSIQLSGKNNPPEFILHINNDFIDKYGGLYDNCRVLEKTYQWVLFFWIICMTDMFNMLNSKYDINKLIYINIHDHPIHRNSDEIIGTDIKKHPFPNMNLHLKNNKFLLLEVTVNPDPTKPIYCWAPKKNYRDIGLPFHDIWMHLLCYDFGKDFNIDSYLKNESNILGDRYIKNLVTTIRSDIGYNNNVGYNNGESNHVYLVIADNNIVKNMLKNVFPNFKILLKDITHFGEGVVLEEEKVKNTLVDFYLLSYSNSIRSYSCYQHGSGFSYWCAKTYNIPYICKLVT